MADLEGAEVDEELALVRDDIRDTRAYLKVEIENVEPEDFVVGEGSEDNSEKAERFFGPKLESLEGRFHTAEQYRQKLKQRI